MKKQRANRARACVFRQQGNVLAEGSYQELLYTGLDFVKLLGPSEESENEPEDETHKTDVTADRDDLESFSVIALPDSVHGEANGEPPAEPVEIAEARTTGKVSRNVHFSYVLAGGNVFKISLLISICIFTQVLCTGCDFWISYWYSIRMSTGFLSVSIKRSLIRLFVSGSTWKTVFLVT